ncbi:uncharacterized protein I303_106240 [Kwoniella dejecticola CBS 10117]|uniref:Alpha/beta hydrolase fold-3 domain-containing protein n=1 Tax=Kwoniella dejecticola CBS 10117 TaxID=1296121 RepID=A0A1A6A1N5_9TREE|nr:uncharacterized protein I303_06259 [Kwoniella dejecticola CBS 10117]OBR83972.1 hypothetical protein I303_06259 [Kwoniella dejecticola CBS 10117]
MAECIQDATASIPSRWSRLLQAKALRIAASLGHSLQHYACPMAPSPSKTEYIDATFGSAQSKRAIRLDIYSPPEPKVESEHESSSNNPKFSSTERPCLMIFHGGGFVIGQGTDDARFAQAAMSKLGAVVVGISYRLAPEYPFPIPVEDCVSSILHIATDDNAARYGIDRDTIILSGFSAGGNLALASLHLLHSLKSPTLNPNEWGYTIPVGSGIEIPNIRGIILFYPLLDYTIPREIKTQNLPRPEYALPASLTQLFDASYLPRSQGDARGVALVDRRDIRLSPALASDELVKALPPVWVTVCEHDMLRQEGLDFANRLKSLGKKVGLSEVQGEKHGWDKPPPISPKASVLEEYNKALDAARMWLA